MAEYVVSIETNPPNRLTKGQSYVVKETGFGGYYILDDTGGTRFCYAWRFTKQPLTPFQQSLRDYIKKELS